MAETFEVGKTYRMWMQVWNHEPELVDATRMDGTMDYKWAVNRSGGSLMVGERAMFENEADAWRSYKQDSEHGRDAAADNLSIYDDRVKTATARLAELEGEG